jgi:nucleoside-diphosphate-sugar epimerase
MDLSAERLGDAVRHPRFEFVEGDISINKEWIEYHIKKCDVALPLVAIATPATYVKNPLSVFELDFEENLRIVKMAGKYGKRVVFPSTSEVYGMCPDKEFDEDRSPLVYGPIRKERWIYSASKQLLDRVIWAMGSAHGLRFTLFRPFNWYGPHLDDVDAPKEGSSRVLTQFLHNILYGVPIKLVDGGHQRRCFTFIEDGIDGLMKILVNENGCADGQIFNIGNPAADLSIRELAHQLLAAVGTYPKFAPLANEAKIVEVSSADYYGANYQDITTRVPSIRKAKECLGWAPTTDFETGLAKTLDFYLSGRTTPGV